MIVGATRCDALGLDVAQAANLKKHIGGVRSIRPEVVIVSPLVRTSVSLQPTHILPLAAQPLLVPP